jgi:hypothetical protein
MLLGIWHVLKKLSYQSSLGMGRLKTDSWLEIGMEWAYASYQDRYKMGTRLVLLLQLTYLTGYSL